MDTQNDIHTINALQSHETIARLWNDEELKRALISQIMQQRKIQNLQPKKINEKDLIIHYFNAWLKVDKKDYIKKLLGHPLITVSDYDEVSRIVKEQKDKGSLYSLATTCGQLAFYSFFMSKHRIFYNFFRANYRFKYLRPFKKFSCCILLFAANILGFEYMMNKRTPILLDKQNYFKKYNIEFDID